MQRKGLMAGHLRPWFQDVIGAARPVVVTKRVKSAETCRILPEMQETTLVLHNVVTASDALHQCEWPIDPGSGEETTV